MKTMTLETTGNREQLTPKKIPARARKLGRGGDRNRQSHRHGPAVLVMGEDLGKRWDVGHVDIPRLREGGTHAPFFALWVPVYFPGAEAVRRTLDLRDAMQSMLDAHQDEMELATTAPISGGS